MKNNHSRSNFHSSQRSMESSRVGRSNAVTTELTPITLSNTTREQWQARRN